MHRRFLGAPFALLFAVCHAYGAGKAPPSEYAAFFEAARKADALTDPTKRCLAYPDLPGNTWAPGVAQARCVTFNTPPAFRLAEIDTLLATPDGAQRLDVAFHRILDAHYQVAAQREQIFHAYRVFDDPKNLDEAEHVAREWQKAAPTSPFAQTALGTVLARRGWEARGTKFVRDTAPESMRRMQAHFLDAATLLGKALKAAPKLLPACETLMEIGRQSSNDLQRVATGACLAADPASYYVVEEMMTAAEPRWGGSPEAMRVIAAYAQARVRDNPLLAILTTAGIGYEARLGDDDARTLAELEPATFLAPDAGNLRYVGGAYLRKDDYWRAFVWLSEALRFMPDYEQESYWRAYTLYQLGYPQWARADAERAVSLEPGDGYNQRMLADILRDVAGPNAARPHYEMAMQEPKIRERAYVEYCRTWIASADRKHADDCTDGLTREYPDNGEAWRLRALVLRDEKDPAAADAMRRFLVTQDADRWPAHREAAAEMRTILASMGEASSIPILTATQIRVRPPLEELVSALARSGIRKTSTRVLVAYDKEGNVVAVKLDTSTGSHETDAAIKAWATQLKIDAKDAGMAVLPLSFSLD